MCTLPAYSILSVAYVIVHLRDLVLSYIHLQTAHSVYSLGYRSPVDYHYVFYIEIKVAVQCPHRFRCSAVSVGVSHLIAEAFSGNVKITVPEYGRHFDLICALVYTREQYGVAAASLIAFYIPGVYAEKKNIGIFLQLPGYFPVYIQLVPVYFKIRKFVHLRINKIPGVTSGKDRSSYGDNKDHQSYDDPYDIAFSDIAFNV